MHDFETYIFSSSVKEDFMLEEYNLILTLIFGKMKLWKLWKSTDNIEILIVESPQSPKKNFKGAVSLIYSDPQCKDGNARFTTVPLKL